MFKYFVTIKQRTQIYGRLQALLFSFHYNNGFADVFALLAHYWQ